MFQCQEEFIYIKECQKMGMDVNYAVVTLNFAGILTKYQQEVMRVGPSINSLSFDSHRRFRYLSNLSIFIR